MKYINKTLKWFIHKDQININLLTNRAEVSYKIFQKFLIVKKFTNYSIWQDSISFNKIQPKDVRINVMYETNL